MFDYRRDGVFVSDNSWDDIQSVPTIQKGDQVEGVTLIQRYLRRFGYLDALGDAELTTGVMDEATSSAIRSFQEFFGLPRTGEFDEVTREVMVRFRCGLPDVGISVGFSSRCPWRQNALSFAFDIGTLDIAGTAEFQAVRTAIATWQVVCPLPFGEVGPDRNPNVLIGWRPPNDPDLDMAGSVIAHADFPPDCGIITDSLPKPLHFDDEHLWSTTGAVTALDVESVGLHEFGHILGLQHSNVASAVMFPTIGLGEIKRELTQDDRDGILDLYSDWRRADLKSID
jgi:peptidoglycan hydrolase-like protein with peptidoglycan-binding domain